MTGRALAAGALSALLGLAACAGPGSGARGQAAQDRDAKLVAGALKAADDGGATFTMQRTDQRTGGSIPAGKMAQVTIQGQGSARGGNLKMAYKESAGSQSVTFDIVIADGQVYVRPHGGSGQWKAAAAGVAFGQAGVRLEFAREVILLARSASGSQLARVDVGFAHEYTFTPAPDQLEQLLGVGDLGELEQSFLKAASGRIDVYLSVNGDHLMRVDTQLSDLDPQDGTRHRSQSRTDYRLGKVAAIQAPANAVQVSPANLFGP